MGAQSGKNKTKVKVVQTDDDQPMSLDGLILQLGGCGTFQVIAAICTYSCYIPAVWGLMMMAFGNYNPGWICLDQHELDAVNNTVFHTRPIDDVVNGTFTTNNLTHDTVSQRYVNATEVNLEKVKANTSEWAKKTQIDDHTCRVWSTCVNGTFSPEASTIVTEWNLMCGESWKTSVIISVQMAGLFIGSHIGGIIGDRFGRKFSIYGGLFSNMITNTIAAFSNSWQMFCAVRFFIGLTCGCILSSSLVYNTEFITQKWRAFLGAFPFWNFFVGTFAIGAVLLKDWRHIHYATAVISFLLFLSVFWIPESMRILAVQGKIKQGEEVVKKVAKVNKVPVPNMEVLTLLARKEATGGKKQRKYNFLDLFHHKLRRASIVVGMNWLFLSIIYYAIGFGVRSLSGNFFVNLSIFAMAAIPVRATAFMIAHKIGRRFGCVLLLSLSCISCVSLVVIQFVVPESSKGTVTTVMAFAANICLESAWGVLVVLGLELYPTPVRALCYGYSNAAARFGGIIAPYLIPKDGLPLFASFLIMAGLLLTCIVGLLTLPETKGRELPDNLFHSVEIVGTDSNVQISHGEADEIQQEKK